MKRYRFRLEQVLRVRRLQEEQARAELQVANGEVTRAVELRTLRVADYRAISAPSGSRSTNDFMAARSSHERAAAAVLAAAVAHDEAVRAAEERRAAWAQAAQAVTALERLDERRRAEHAAEAERTAQTEIDDLVTSRHGKVA